MTTELTYPELISEIRRLSLDKQNGTIFISSTDGHVARIVLDKGIITYLIFDSNYSGSEAIPHIQTIKLARLQFVGGTFESYQAGTLPSTKEIFEQLSAVKIIPEKSSDFPTSTKIIPNNYSSASTDINKAIEYIKIILADYIGPIANVLCDDYLQQIKPSNTKSDITVMIETLAIEIEGTENQEEFKKKILKTISPSNS
jgi:hypothetical protein